MASYLLDTNVCIDLLRGKAQGHALPALKQCRLPAVAVAELWAGVHKSAQPTSQAKMLNAFLGLFEIAPFDANAARTYGEIRAELETAGTPIGPLNQLIAAQAKSTAATLITANLREFKRVPGLSCLAWR
jgi:tRNA(fMet)-specific endonuclease VapC